MKRHVPTFHGWITSAATWWLGPPRKLRHVACHKCGVVVNIWRLYADGRRECIPCAEGLK